LVGILFYDVLEKRDCYFFSGCKTERNEILGKFNYFKFSKSLLVPELKKRLGKLLKFRGVLLLRSKVRDYDRWVLFEVLSLALLAHPLGDLIEDK
jgi:hypothetical protein